MRKSTIILHCLAATLFLASCATSKQARNYKNILNGNWILQSVSTEGISGKIKATSFNEASSDCFNGSAWYFNEDNNIGTYTLNQGADGCTATKRNIRWSVYEATGEPKSLQFKRLDNKLKEIDENSGGFRLTIVELNKTTMILKSPLTFEGKPASLVYSFVKK